MIKSEKELARVSERKMLPSSGRSCVGNRPEVGQSLPVWETERSPSGVT